LHPMVKAYDAAGNHSAASTSLAVTTQPSDVMPPTRPTDLKVTDVTANSVSLTWTAATDNYGVAGYEINRDSVKVGTSLSTSYTDNNLSPNTPYSYTLQAFDAAPNYSVASAAANGTTKPGNIATVYYYRRGWPTVNIHYSPPGGTWTAVPGVAMDKACPSYKVKVLNLGAATGLQAVFNNGAGTWDNNNGRNYQLGTGISVLKGGQVTTGTNPCDTEPPTAPTNLVQQSESPETVDLSRRERLALVGPASKRYQDFHSVPLVAGAVANNSVTLTWTAATDNVGVAGYGVFRDGVKSGTATGTSYGDTTVAATTTYTYTVKAYDAVNNESAASNSLAVTTTAKDDTEPPSVPVGLASTDVTDTTATISWQASTDNGSVTGYQVFRNGVQAGSTSTTSYTDSGLTDGTTYSYTVKAYDAADNVSEASSLLSVTTQGGSTASIYYKQGFAPAVCMHYRPQGGNWTPVPGVHVW
jgi:chitodextrinase